MPRLFCPFLLIPGNEGVLMRFSDLRWQLPRGHQHDRLEMNLVLKGRGEILFKDRKHPLAPGNLLWIFPGQWHAPLNWSADLEMWIVEFRRPLVARAARGERCELRTFCRERRYCRRVSSECLVSLSRLLESVESTILDYETFNQGLLFALHALWDAFLEAEDVGQLRLLHPAIGRTIDVLNHPETGELSVKETARRVGLAPRRLSSLFHRETGQTVPEYRNRIRLQRFFEQFEKEPATNLLFLALESGFGSYAQFHRVFKQSMHKSPKAWLAER